MTTPVDIGTLIVSTPGIVGGRPRIAETGIAVATIAVLSDQGVTPEEIVSAKYPHLTLAQVHAALAYYHANRAEIEASIEAENRAYETWRADEMSRREKAERKP